MAQKGKEFRRSVIKGRHIQLLGEEGMAVTCRTQSTACPIRDLRQACRISALSIPSYSTGWAMLAQLRRRLC